MLTIAASASEICPVHWRYALRMTCCLTPSRVISRFDDISRAMSCKGIAGVSIPLAAISPGGSMHAQRHRSVQLLKRYCDGGQNGKVSACRRIFSADANMGCLVSLSGFRSSHQLAYPDGPRRSSAGQSCAYLHWLASIVFPATLRRPTTEARDRDLYGCRFQRCIIRSGSGLCWTQSLTGSSTGW